MESLGYNEVSYGNIRQRQFLVFNQGWLPCHFWSSIIVMGERGNISGTSSMRILLIEDDQVIADFIQKGMKEAGFAIDHFDDGSIGLHAALTQDFDVGILDLMLPGLDGLSILDRYATRRRICPLLF